MTNVKLDIKDRSIIDQTEFNQVLEKAQQIEDTYYRLRASCLLVVFYKTGKRVSEIAKLLMSNITVKKDRVVFLFELDKKRRRVQLPDGTSKSEKKIVKTKKAINREESYTDHVIEYYEFMKEHYPKSTYLFPSTTNFFGVKSIINNQKHLSRVQVWRILKQLKPDLWCHLFRETIGAKIAEREGRSLDAVFKIKNRLNLEKVDTAYRYVERYAEDIIEVEDEELV